MRRLMIDPLRIAKLQALGGTIGVTLCPGRQIRGMPPRDLEDDLDIVVSEGFVRAAVLLEDPELERVAPTLLGGYAARGIEVHRFPITDFCTPDEPEDFRVFVDTLASHLRGGDSVLVHCKGGIGRAGLTAACLLTLDGFGPEDALEAVSAVRPGAVPFPNQEKFVEAFASNGGA